MSKKTNSPQSSSLDGKSAASYKDIQELNMHLACASYQDSSKKNVQKLFGLIGIDVIPKNWDLMCNLPLLISNPQTIYHEFSSRTSKIQDSDFYKNQSNENGINVVKLTENLVDALFTGFMIDPQKNNKAAWEVRHQHIVQPYPKHLANLSDKLANRKVSNPPSQINRKISPVPDSKEISIIRKCCNDVIYNLRDELDAQSLSEYSGLNITANYLRSLNLVQIYRWKVLHFLKGWKSVPVANLELVLGVKVLPGVIPFDLYQVVNYFSASTSFDLKEGTLEELQKLPVFLKLASWMYRWIQNFDLKDPNTNKTEFETNLGKDWTLSEKHIAERLIKLHYLQKLDTSTSVEVEEVEFLKNASHFVYTKNDLENSDEQDNSVVRDSDSESDYLDIFNSDLNSETAQINDSTNHKDKKLNKKVLEEQNNNKPSKEMIKETISFYDPNIGVEFGIGVEKKKARIKEAEEANIEALMHNILKSFQPTVQIAIIKKLTPMEEQDQLLIRITQLGLSSQLGPINQTHLNDEWLAAHTRISPLDHNSQGMTLSQFRNFVNSQMSIFSQRVSSALVDGEVPQQK